MVDTTTDGEHTYRLFRLDPTGDTQGSSVTIKAESDAAAVRHAQDIASDVGVMLCKGTHVVAGWTASAKPQGA